MPDILSKYTEIVNQRLKELLDLKNVHPMIKGAMNYSIMAGGKRLRPTLNIMANALLSGNMRETLDIACAIEMIHTYSLIHDDLPAMDNDEYRRGRRTTHVVYGEDMGILAGDALLNYAFETAFKAFVTEPEDALLIGRALGVLGEKAGIYGMIGGQVIDVKETGHAISKE
ncbi:MAG: polyprenyl synthetase family protein, partial [Lachnospiraceae bacterium]